MAYQKNTWASGDVVTSAKLNNIENGIAGGGVLVVGGEMSGSTMTLDKTWNEINNASLAVFSGGGDSKIIMICCETVGAENDYRARFTNIDSEETPYVFSFSTTSADGYPSYNMG